MEGPRPKTPNDGRSAQPSRRDLKASAGRADGPTDEQLDIMARYLAEKLTQLLIDHEHLTPPADHDR